MPTAAFINWMEANVGPRGILWHPEKQSDGFDIYIAKPDKAMLFKLTWS
jgi:hypothetical protein